MPFKNRLQNAQYSLDQFNWDGWLLYDFRKINDLACYFLDIPKSQMLTRRLFYWIPRKGTPIKLVHRIESKSLDHLPGKVLMYSTWKELEEYLGQFLQGCKKVAMEYSPRNAIPYVSKVDAGMVDLVRSYGIDVVSSADLLQEVTSVWDEQQLEMHFAAMNILETSINRAWNLIGAAIRKGQQLTERDVQSFILEEFKRHDCVCDDPPICAINAHSADPHYCINPVDENPIKPGDFVLIDLWCKKQAPRAVYADITCVGVVAPSPTLKQQKIFEIVRKARDAAMELLVRSYSKGETLMGWEVDQACRQVIIDAGYGQYFTHRTGHNIGEKDHGDGANIDNFETQDCRILLPCTCFSIEPGIYLPGEFGVRLEHDVYIESDGSVRVTGSLQEEIVCIST